MRNPPQKNLPRGERSVDLAEDKKPLQQFQTPRNFSLLQTQGEKNQQVVPGWRKRRKAKHQKAQQACFKKQGKKAKFIFQCFH
jgi:hypothetical protein